MGEQSWFISIWDRCFFVNLFIVVFRNNTIERGIWGW